MNQTRTINILETEINKLKSLWYDVSDFKPSNNYTGEFFYIPTDDGKWEVVESYESLEGDGISNHKFVTNERKHGVFENDKFAELYVKAYHTLQEIISPDPEVE